MKRKPKKPYRDQLNELVQQYRQQRPAECDGALVVEETDLLKVDADGNLTEEGARQLHEALCRRAGMDAEELVQDWNRRCPRDPW